MKTKPKKPLKDLPLVVAHLLGGANGVDFSAPLDPTEISRRVALAITFANEIQKQLSCSAKATQDSTQKK